MEKNTTYYVEIDVSEEMAAEAFRRADARIQANIDSGVQFGERLDQTNEDGYGGSNCRHGYAAEEIYFMFNPEAIRSPGVGDKYDYRLGGKYVDMKAMQTRADIETIAERGYKSYILAEQAILSVEWCEINNVEPCDYMFVIAYWSGTPGKMTVVSNRNLILEDMFLNIVPEYVNPPNTSGASEPQLQFPVPMVPA